MSKKIYISAISVAIVALVAGLTFKSDTSPSYSPKESIFFDQAVGRYDIAKKYNELIKSDENGEIRMKDIYKARQTQQVRARNSKADPIGLIWEPMGPTNVGGRTRAVLADRFDQNVVVAGAVGGGFYVSTNQGETWWPKLMDENNLVADIVQGANGAFYVGTGPSLDDWFGGLQGTNHASDNTIGTGIYRTAGIYQDWEHIVVVDDADNQIFNRITHMATHPTDPDVLFVGTFSGGLRVSRNATATSPTFVRAEGIQASRVVDVDVSPDGNTVIAISGSSNGNGTVWRSTDGGLNFVRDTVLSGTARIECAIAPSDGNIVYLSCVEGAGCLHSILQSNDGGDNWFRIASGGSQGNQSTFDPFANPGTNCQGNYDNMIGVFPDDPGHILVGGVQLWEGRQAPNSNPPRFGWSLIATTNGGPLSGYGFYVHADKHGIDIPSGNLVYLGTDGGVAKSTDGGFFWSQNNINYQTTQFYSLAIAPQNSPYEIVMGGTQDNGSLLVGFPIPSLGDNPKYAFEVTGGDGFDCDISRVSSMVFTTSQNGTLIRTDGSSAGGSQPAQETFYDDELEPCGSGGCGTFYTAIEFHDVTDVENPIYGVLYRATEEINAGDTITYQSATGGYPLRIAAPQSLNPGDSIVLPDRVQTQLAFANFPDNGVTIYITRDAATFVGEPDWYQAVGSQSYPDVPSGNIFEMEFSEDGNHLFFGAQGGDVFRVSNLNSAFDEATGDNRESTCVLTCTRIASNLGGNVNGIALDPNNNDHMIVTLSGYGRSNTIVRITNALTATSGGANAQAINGDFTDIPVFDPEIDVSDGDIVVLGTEYGIYTSRNAFSENNPNRVEWAEENMGLGRFPVYEVKQQQSKTAYDIENGVLIPALNYKSYYISTHGAGFFKTESLVGINDIAEGNKENNESSLLVYPNPVQLNSKLEFELNESANTTVRIFNLSGQVVNELNLGTLPTGKQRIDLQTGKLKAGTYIVNLQAGDVNEVVKIVKAQ